MLRVQPTGNSTFDKVEVTAYGVYDSAIHAPNVEANALVSAEIVYFYTLWQSALGCLGPTNTGLTGDAGATQYPGSGVTPYLDNTAAMLAANLRRLGQTLPRVYWYPASMVPTEAAEGSSYVAGDTFTITGGSLENGSLIATGKVDTVDSGGVETCHFTTSGLYTSPPANDAATVHLTGSGDDALTVTVLWVQYAPANTL